MRALRWLEERGLLSRCVLVPRAMLDEEARETQRSRPVSRPATPRDTPRFATVSRRCAACCARALATAPSVASHVVEQLAGLPARAPGYTAFWDESVDAETFALLLTQRQVLADETCDRAVATLFATSRPCGQRLVASTSAASSEEGTMTTRDSPSAYAAQLEALKGLLCRFVEKDEGRTGAITGEAFCDVIRQGLRVDVVVAGGAALLPATKRALAKDTRSSSTRRFLQHPEDDCDCDEGATVVEPSTSCWDQFAARSAASVPHQSSEGWRAFKAVGAAASSRDLSMLPCTEKALQQLLVLFRDAFDQEVAYVDFWAMLHTESSLRKRVPVLSELYSVAVEQLIGIDEDLGQALQAFIVHVDLGRERSKRDEVCDHLATSSRRPSSRGLLGRFASSSSLAAVSGSRPGSGAHRPVSSSSSSRSAGPCAVQGDLTTQRPPLSPLEPRGGGGSRLAAAFSGSLSLDSLRVLRVPDLNPGTANVTRAPTASRAEVARDVKDLARSASTAREKRRAERTKAQRSSAERDLRVSQSQTSLATSKAKRRPVAVPLPQHDLSEDVLGRPATDDEVSTTRTQQSLTRAKSHTTTTTTTEMMMKTSKGLTALYSSDPFFGFRQQPLAQEVGTRANAATTRKRFPKVRPASSVERAAESSAGLSPGSQRLPLSMGWILRWVFFVMRVGETVSVRGSRGRPGACCAGKPAVDLCSSAFERISYRTRIYISAILLEKTSRSWQRNRKHAGTRLAGARRVPCAS